MLTAFGRGLRGKVLPGWCPFCGLTLFDERGPWLRDGYVCVRCRSLPRHRSLMCALGRWVPRWREMTIFESSPSGPASAKIAAECPTYMPSQFLEGVPSGEVVNEVRSEDLRSLSLADASVDVVVTGDVFEHVVDPARAFQEIARVLRPGGAHVFTVPIYSRSATVVRVDDQGVELAPPDYHGNPVGDGRSLVVREWAPDIVEFIDAAAGTPTERWPVRSRWRGIRGEMTDVLISRKPTSP